MTTGKTIALTRQTFVDKVMALLFNISMQNAGLDEAQAGIKIAGKNINNLRYADNTSLWQKAKRN